MKKLLPLLFLLFSISVTQRTQAQRIVSFSPDTIVQNGPSGFYHDTVDIRLEGVHLLQDTVIEVRFHIPSSRGPNLAPPFISTIGQLTPRVLNDSTIRVIVFQVPFQLIKSQLDVEVELASGTLTKDRALTGDGGIPQFPTFTVTPVQARPGQTLDVLISNTQHIPGQISSTLQMDFKVGDPYAFGVNYTTLIGRNTLANITVPANTKPGCYDGYFWAKLIGQLPYAQVLQNMICVSGTRVQYPAHVRGTVFNDQDWNCEKGDVERGLHRVVLQALPGPYYAVTDSGGAYDMELPYGTYTISQQLFGLVQPFCPIAGQVITVDSATPDARLDFADTIEPHNDLRLGVWMGRLRPGMDGWGYLGVENQGDSTERGTAYLVLDDSLQFVQSNPPPSSVQGDTLVYQFSNLRPKQEFRVSFNYTLPPNPALMGDTLTSCARVRGSRRDADLSNNNDCFSSRVTNSYDPNDKSVLPSGNLLPQDSVLRYTIRFQNTGTDTAFFVVVRDTLSSGLDVGSIKTLLTSHPCSFSIKAGNVAEWRFPDIMLLDSGRNERRSHGVIQFSINRKKGLALGTRIDNRAGIFFDFNPAIITNRTQTLYQDPLRVREGGSKDAGIRLYPNPLNKHQSILWVQSSTDLNGGTLTLTNMLGKTVLSGSPIESGRVSIDRASIRNGLYHYRIERLGRLDGSGTLVLD